MIRFEQRASTVLFNLLRAHAEDGPVLVPENICGVVLLVLKKLGRPVELVDISLATLGIDHEGLLRRWADRGLPRPAGLIYVRPYGHIADAGPLFDQLRNLLPRALIIDDRCLGFPDREALLDDSVDAILYSTGYAKCVDLGHGGFAVTRESVPYHEEQGPFDEAADRHWAEVVKNAVATGSPIVYQDSEWLDRRRPGPWEWHCLLMRDAEQESRAMKRRVNAIYREGLPRSIQVDCRFNEWRFNLWVRSSREVVDALFRHGLFASSHYRSVAPLLGQGVSSTCDTLGSHIVNLFNHRYVGEEMAERIVNVLKDSGQALDPGPAVASIPVGDWRV